MADIFSVIADATRRELLQHLLDATLSPDNKEGELAVSELVDRMDATQPTVSKHLKVLRDIGLVQVREEGQHRYYRLDPTPLEDVEDWMIPFLSVEFDEEAGAGVPPTLRGRVPISRAPPAVSAALLPRRHTRPAVLSTTRKSA